MLKVRVFADEDRTECVTDVNELFAQVTLSGSEKEKDILAKIEQGSYNDSDTFIDRFGCKLHLSDMSTGCKAALCVLHFPDKEINLIECGNNAIDVILSVCDSGSVAIPERGITIVDYSTGSISVLLDGYLFTTISRLNYYLSDERPFEPDFSLEGVQHVQ